VRRSLLLDVLHCLGATASKDAFLVILQFHAPDKSDDPVRPQSKV
jgi:hypothetical protein